MHQDMDRLAGIQTQTPVWIVGAGPEAGDAESHVWGWLAARIDLKIGRVERYMRGATAEYGEERGEDGARFDDRRHAEKVGLLRLSLVPSRPRLCCRVPDLGNVVALWVLP